LLPKVLPRIVNEIIRPGVSPGKLQYRWGWPIFPTSGRVRCSHPTRIYTIFGNDMNEPRLISSRVALLRMFQAVAPVYSLWRMVLTMVQTASCRSGFLGFKLIPDGRVGDRTIIVSGRCRVIIVIGAVV
jgi:hypothetical protein